VVGIGYTAYFTYNYITNISARDEFGKKLDEIEDSTGLNLKQVAQVTGGAVQVEPSRPIA
jgi:hypothetical protein